MHRCVAAEVDLVHIAVPNRFVVGFPNCAVTLSLGGRAINLARERSDEILSGGEFVRVSPHSDQMIGTSVRPVVCDQLNVRTSQLSGG